MSTLRVNRKNVKKKNIETAVETNLRKRFEFLTNQPEIFSHFMKNGAAQESSSNIRTRKNTARQAPLNAADSKHRRHRQKENEENEEFLADAVEVKNVITQFESTPFYIKNGQMRDYQIRGLNWMISLFENGISGILADEMGLGKTLQTISLLGYLKHYRGISKPHLIIAPKSTLESWKKEFKRWCPSLKVMSLIGSKMERAELINKEFMPQDWEVCITTYEMVLRQKLILGKVKWRYLVIDEAHRIKNEKSMLAKAVREFKTTNRLLLTGTPLQNNMHELWSLLNFLLPDVFDSSEDFDNWFKTKRSVDISLVERLHAILKPFLLRRIKSDVEKSLLPKKEVKVYVGLTQMQREQYRKILMKDLDIINCLGMKAKMRLLNLLMQLRKCTNHPYLFDGTEAGPPYTNGEHLIFNCGKMILLDKLLHRMKEQGSRVLLFCQMTRMMDIIEDYFFLRGFQYCRLDGLTSYEDRESQIEEFNANNSEKFIFMLSTRAGGLGISLPSADVVILYDSDWNPQVDLQAMDRAHRIGQKKQVKVFRLITENTIEEKIVEKAEVKLRLDRLVIQQGRLADTQKIINKKDLFHMVRFGAEHVLASKDSEITDEDIDTILQKGEEKTEKQNKKLESMSESSLRDFSLDFPIYSCYDFEGEDYKKLNKPIGNLWIDLPKRERKSSYFKYFHDKRPTCPNIPKIYDFQFFPPRLSEILKKEELYYLKSINYEIDYSVTEDTIQQIDIDLAQPLTDDEVAERKVLMKKGFIKWDKKDFDQFIEALKNYGLENLDKIYHNVEGKTPEEVRKYSDVFWERHKELKNINRILETIIRKNAIRQARCQRQAAIQEALNAKMCQYHDPSTQLEIKYEEPCIITELRWRLIDRFLICTLHKIGFGTNETYARIKNELCNSQYFQRDAFAQVLTEVHIQKRCEKLVTLIQKELEELEQAKKVRELLQSTVKIESAYEDLNDRDVKQDNEKPKEQAKTNVEKQWLPNDSESWLEEGKSEILKKPDKETPVTNSSYEKSGILKEMINTKIHSVLGKRPFQNGECDEVEKLKKKYRIRDICIQLTKLPLPENMVRKHVEKLSSEMKSRLRKSKYKSEIFKYP